MIIILKRAISRLKRFAVTVPVLFFDLISNELTFSHMTIVKGRKNLLLILLIRLKKANISVDMLYDEKDADFVFSLFCC